MSTIKSIYYQNTMKEKGTFEIVDIQVFMETRPVRHLKHDFRLSFWTLMYITQGEGIHFVDFEKYQYKAGDIIIIQKNQVNRFVVNKDVRGYIIMIDEPFFFEGQGHNNTSFMDFFDRSHKSPIMSLGHLQTSTDRYIIDLIYKEYIKTDKTYNEDLIRALFQSFIFSINEYSKDNLQIKEVPAYRTYHKFSQLIELHYKEMKSVEEYSKMMMVSKKTINNATRSIVGLSAKQFIIDRLILEIKRYLSQGDLMNYEISDRLGFDEPSNLTKFFKHYVGISPTEFKENLKIK